MSMVFAEIGPAGIKQDGYKHRTMELEVTVSVSTDSLRRQRHRDRQTSDRLGM